MDAVLKAFQDLFVLLSALPADRYYAFLVFVALMSCLGLIGFTIYALTRKR